MYLEMGNRKIILYARHCGLDLDFMKKIIQSDNFKMEYEKVKEQTKGKYVIGSVDRRSPLSGAVEKFVGYKRFLKRFPDYKNKTILIQVLSA